ncbi:MAG: 2-C-methyl-D-erythritol 2,4-cyclodiphosphate synthase [Ignavibacteria bacterium RBG_13_36_8]|nr:MAG: 2-C-methyl-D-erythritol 2,4-cyclodiphosphate synthase [Ignavibacteria bacterium RBG_13_36_8]
MRTGFGYDVHAFAENRNLILGGVEIPFEKGLKGHSDADVLIHAVCDALLGALALGDIGKHFPDTNPKWKDADSKIFLKEINKLVHENGYVINNIDSTIVLQRPKIAPFIEKMRTNFSNILGLGIDQISIKATTSEGIGFVGRGEGAAAFASVLIMSKEN